MKPNDIDFSSFCCGFGREHAIEKTLDKKETLMYRGPRTMKDSGIEWIGEIPSDWKVERLKYHFQFHKGLAITKADLKPKGVGVISYGQIHAKYNTGTQLTKDLLRYTSERNADPDCRVFSGDFIFADTSEDLDGLGNCVYCDSIEWDEEVYAGYHSIAMVPNQRGEDNRYLAYLFTTDYWRNQIRATAMGIKVYSLTQRMLANAFAVFPTKEEQKIIADYLDRTCADIDQSMKDIETSMDELKAYKAALITDTVTHGLHPDAPMKDSGIEWIGKIPSDWKTIRVKYLFCLRDEKNELPLEKVNLLSLYTDIGVFPHGQVEERGNKAVKAEGYKIVHKKDIVVNIILAWMGAIGISDYDGVTSPAYDIYRPINDSVCPKYYHYLFRTKLFASECHKYGRGIMAMRWRTYSSEFKNFIVPLPPVQDRAAIVDFLDQKCAAIDEALAQKKQLLAGLTEYKKSLIYEAVTGKMDLRFRR